MTLKCARCGLKQTDIEPKTIEVPPTEADPNPEPIVVQRFAVYDAQRDMYICHGCLDMYNELSPLASEYGMLEEHPEARANLLSMVPRVEFGFFKLLLPGQQF